MTNIELLEEAVRLSSDMKDLQDRKQKLIDLVSIALHMGQLTKEEAKEIDNIADLNYF